MKINELRRSSVVSPRKSAVLQFVEYVSSLTPEQFANTYVSFTSIDKLGINPKSKYDTPNGIYSYPVKYVMDSYQSFIDTEPNVTPAFIDIVPFAGSAAFLNVFQVNGNVIDLADTAACAGAIIDLKALHSSVTAIPKEYKQTTAAEKFWSLSLYIANGKQPRPASNSTIAKKWNTVFRSTGIDGVVDSSGSGIIHESEPTQAVFFSSSVIRNVKRFVNTRNSGSASKQPIQKNKIGNFIVKRILRTPGIIDTIQSTIQEIWLLNSLALHHKSGDAYRYSSTSQRMELELQRKLEQAARQFFGDQYKTAAYDIQTAIDDSLSFYIRGISLSKITPETDTIDSVKKATGIYFTAERKRASWKKFISVFAQKIKDAITRAARSNPEFGEHIDHIVPDHMKDSK